jgi:hypothetical protein
MAHALLLAPLMGESTLWLYLSDLFFSSMGSPLCHLSSPLKKKNIKGEATPVILLYLALDRKGYIEILKFEGMETLRLLKLYYELFSFLVKNPKTELRYIAEYYRKTGRGRSPSTWGYHIEQMFQKKISREPIMLLKSHEQAYITAYFCEYEKKTGFHDVIRNLSEDKEITYGTALSSRDFFITSTNEKKNLEEYNLQVKDKSVLYTPLYPVPTGWGLSMEEAFANVLDSDFRKGVLPRTLYRYLDWDDLDWKIYLEVRKRLRSFEYTATAKVVGSTPTTVMTRFREKIVPKCIQINYFFPDGYDQYLQAFLKIETDCESSLVKALGGLPCTSYVYPLENCMIILLFHKNIDLLILMLKKLEKKKVLDSCLLYSPLMCTTGHSI